ncbi:MAG: hypothetical protein LBR16_01385 [Treponema sp.]|jgi:hypothetical protein|nr:hypothetical protein [Treponema sp.]
MAVYPGGTQLDAFIDNYFDFYALDRAGFGFSLSGGYQLVPGLYVSGSLLYSLDRMRGSGYEIAFHQPALLAGLRWYPMPGKRFLQLGLEAGPAWLLFDNNIAFPGYENRGALGVGVNLSAACDFNAAFTGPHWQLCANLLYSYINGGSVLNPGISVKIAYKHSKKPPTEQEANFNEMSLAAGIVVPLIAVVSTWIGFSLIPPRDRS